MSVLRCLAIAGAVGLGVLISWMPTAVGYLGWLCCLGQLALLFLLVWSSGGLLTLTSAFGVVWFLLFPLRLMILWYGRGSLYLLPPVRFAGGSQFEWMWLVTTCGFTAFVTGAMLVRRVGHQRRIESMRLPRSTYILLALGSLVVSGVELALHLHLGGFVAAVGSLSIFGVGAASFYDAECRPRVRPSASMALAATAALLGYASGFKALALYPVAAWCVGYVAQRRRLYSPAVIVGFLALGLSFTLIQGQRNAAHRGERGAITTLLTSDLHHFSLAHGEAHTYRGLAIVNNIGGGVVARLGGADSVFVIRSAVPSRIAFLHGETLWQPAVSAVPVLKTIVPLRFRELSLGRYINVTFITQSPSTDPSSQATTFPGDLYMNFGSSGIIVGLLLLGLLYSWYDNRFPVHGPITAGLFCYVGFPLLTLESNLAFALVSSAVNLLVVMFAMRLTSRYSILTGSRSSHAIA